jgi:hypothetical protein
MSCKTHGRQQSQEESMHFSNLEYCEILPKVNVRKRLIIALSLPPTLYSLFMTNFSRLVFNASKYATWSQGAIVF